MCYDECILITDHIPIPPHFRRITTTHGTNIELQQTCIIKIAPYRWFRGLFVHTHPSQTPKHTGNTSECHCSQAELSDEDFLTIPQTHHPTIPNTADTKTLPQFVMHSCLHQRDTISGVLGALVGLLLLLLSAVVTGWAWTCWTMQKRTRYTRTGSAVASNSTIKGS